MAEKRILLSGACGFIGSRIQSLLLKRGDSLRILTRKKDSGLSSVDCVVGDLTDLSTCRRAVKDAAIVIHAAGEKYDRARFWEVNVRGTENLLIAAIDEGIERFVHVSSVGVVGADPLRPRVFNEDAFCEPHNAYERTKWEAEKLVRHAGNGGLRVAILRPSNVFGEGDQRTGLLSLIRSVKRGHFVYIGGRHAISNYVFVDDVAHACLTLAEHPAAVGRIYNLSDDCSMGEFVDALADDLGVARPWLELPASLSFLIRTGLRVLRRLPGFSRSRIIARLTALNNQVRFPRTRLTEELGFVCPVGWREGLCRMVEWYRCQGML